MLTSARVIMGMGLLMGCINEGDSALPSDGELVSPDAGKRDGLEERVVRWSATGERTLPSDGTLRGVVTSSDDGEIVTVSGDWLKASPKSRDFQVRISTVGLREVLSDVAFMVVQVGPDGEALPVVKHAAVSSGCFEGPLTRQHTFQYFTSFRVNQADHSFEGIALDHCGNLKERVQGPLPSDVDAPTFAYFPLPIGDVGRIAGDFNYDFTTWNH